MSLKPDLAPGLSGMRKTHLSGVQVDVFYYVAHGRAPRLRSERQDYTSPRLVSSGHVCILHGGHPVPRVIL